MLITCPVVSHLKQTKGDNTVRYLWQRIIRFRGERGQGVVGRVGIRMGVSSLGYKVGKTGESRSGIATVRLLMLWERERKGMMQMAGFLWMRCCVAGCWKAREIPKGSGWGGLIWSLSGAISAPAPSPRLCPHSSLSLPGLLISFSFHPNLSFYPLWLFPWSIIMGLWF